MARALLLGFVILVVAAVATRTIAATSPAAPDRLSGTVVWPSGMRRAPAFALRDQAGRLVTKRSLRGRVWAITFLDSSCTKACPIAARDLAIVQHMIGSHAALSVIVVSVLPSYDTAARVRAFARKAGLTGDWHWLLGPHPKLAPVWREYGIQVVSGLEHTAVLYLVDGRGDVRVADAIPFVPKQLAGSVRVLDAAAANR